MNAWLEIQRESGIDKRKLRKDSPDSIAAIADGCCPGCAVTPFRVAGMAPQIMPDNETLRSGGRCLACQDNVGYLYAKPGTIFGLREDERVLSGPWKVY